MNDTTYMLLVYFFGQPKDEEHNKYFKIKAQEYNDMKEDFTKMIELKLNDKEDYEPFIIVQKKTAQFALLGHPCRQITIVVRKK